MDFVALPPGNQVRSLGLLGIEEIIVRVFAEDGEGNVATSTFTIVFDEPQSDSQQDSEPADQQENAEESEEEDEEITRLASHARGQTTT